MKQANTFAEFEEFAESKGHKVERTKGRNGETSHVVFGQDEDAATAFHAEAHEAGFDATKGRVQAAWGDPPLSEIPEDWIVSFTPEAQ